MAAQHEMKLAEKDFERIRSGEKTLDMRLFDEKRQLLRLGDMIEFKKFPRLEEKISVKIIGLLRYKNFDQLIEDVPAAMLGFQEKDKPYLKSGMYEIYTPAEEQEYGVLGIRIRKVS